MRRAVQSLMTVDEYRALPEDGRCYQLIGGELKMAPAPRRYHQDISRNLEAALIRYLENHPIGTLYDAPFDVVLSPHDVVQPDICIYLAQHYPRLTELGADGAPDFVAEILSPSNASLDRGAKLRLYTDHGVAEYWIIDPEAKTIEVYCRQQGQLIATAHISATDPLSSRTLPGFQIDSAEIFRPGGC